MAPSFAAAEPRRRGARRNEKSWGMVCPSRHHTGLQGGSCAETRAAGREKPGGYFRRVLCGSRSAGLRSAFG